MILTGKNTVVILAVSLLLLGLAPFGIAQTKPPPEWTNSGSSEDRVSLSETSSGSHSPS